MDRTGIRRGFLRSLLSFGGAAVARPGLQAAPARAALPSHLADICMAREGRSRRSSSWNRTGKNADRILIGAGETATIAEMKGAGCVQHIWMTVNSPEPDFLRRLVFRAWWDGETTPSIECPLGDFFGVGHARATNYWSMPLNMVTGPLAQRGGRAGMNCFFPMPFARGARMTVENQGAKPLNALYYYVDYVELPSVPDQALRFHAQWRRVNPTKPAAKFPDKDTLKKQAGQIVNLDGKENYVILEAKGRGHYVGCNVSVDNIDPLPGGGWFGEGDDMIFIDGEAMPSLVGTGTEDYFCAAWGYPGGHNSMPYHGISLAGSLEKDNLWAGKWTMYRYHLQDPILFTKSIKVTIEHGHGNIHADDYSSAGYWYQTEPHMTFPALLPVEKRLPIPDAESSKMFEAARSL
jgi:hypothetical protein